MDELRELLEKATPCSIVPGTFIIYAEDYHLALALLRMAAIDTNV